MTLLKASMNCLSKWRLPMTNPTLSCLSTRNHMDLNPSLPTVLTTAAVFGAVHLIWISSLHLILISFHYMEVDHLVLLTSLILCPILDGWWITLTLVTCMMITKAVVVSLIGMSIKLLCGMWLMMFKLGILSIATTMPIIGKTVSHKGLLRWQLSRVMPGNQTAAKQVNLSHCYSLLIVAQPLLTKFSWEKLSLLPLRACVNANLKYELLMNVLMALALLSTTMLPRVSLSCLLEWRLPMINPILI